jgi:hypothetical protein
MSVYAPSRAFAASRLSQNFLRIWLLIFLVALLLPASGSVAFRKYAPVAIGGRA